MSLRDQYFRDALQALTGVNPPASFSYDPDRWNLVLSGECMQDWASLNARPHWACGISMLEAARMLVDDAESNCNIMSKMANYPAKFETDQRVEEKS